MSVPLQITVRGMEPTETIDFLVKEQLDRLNQVSDRITHCHVTVEAPSHRHAHGGHFKVAVELTIPGRDVVATRDAHDHGGHEDVHVAVKDAFKAARRQLLEKHDRERPARGAAE